MRDYNLSLPEAERRMGTNIWPGEGGLPGPPTSKADTLCWLETLSRDWRQLQAGNKANATLFSPMLLPKQLKAFEPLFSDLLKGKNCLLQRVDEIRDIKGSTAEPEADWCSVHACL